MSDSRKTDSNSTAPNLKPYHKPALENFGKVADLTAGGSGQASENNQGGVFPRP